MQVGIIGAGIAGMATAVRLASRGHAVTVLEANAYPGGKLSAFEQEGFRFDAGPSLFTMPQYVDALFECAGEDSGALFRYQKVPLACRYFWPDGTVLNAWTDVERFAAEVEQVLGVKAARVRDFLAQSARKYALAGRIFLEKSLHKPDTWFRPDAFAAMLRMPFYDLFSTMHRVHEQHFRHPKLVQLFDRFATYNGSDPFKAPGMLTIIPHFEHNLGVYYPEGGMHAITRSIYALSLKKGVQYRFSTPVAQITTHNGRATGLRTTTENLPFDAVVSNMDIFYTYKKLLPTQPAPERILRQPKSSSALIFYWGITQQFSQLDLHNIFFSADYQEEFRCLAAGEVSDDPTIYLNITSKYTPDDAPPGAENWFVMLNVPADSGQDWAHLAQRARSAVLAKLGRRLGVDLEPLMHTEAILDPPGIDQRTASHRGALYGYSSNNLFSAFLRHPNFSGKLKGLYCCGGSVHPGGGIPLCLLSAKITDELMARDIR
jgi:phytoene desaturase